MKPEFPLHIKFDDGEEWILETIEEVECNLEWFDTDDDDKSALVFDNYGKSVRLKVEALKLLVCELIQLGEVGCIITEEAQDLAKVLNGTALGTQKFLTDGFGTDSSKNN